MKLVVVRSFNDYISAYIILGRLKEEDIVCSLRDEHSVTTGPFLSNISGGIKLEVPEAQVERALRLLQQYEQQAGA